jgi:hypothetical protein
MNTLRKRNFKFTLLFANENPKSYTAFSLILIRSLLALGSGIGTADNRAFVYECFGFLMTSSAFPISTQ